MDRQIRTLAFALLALFVILFAQANYIQVFAAKGLANNPANIRLLLEDFATDRGEILARDEQTVLARSRATTGKFKYLRSYPQGSLYAHITGFHAVLLGRTDLESSMNEWLSGRASQLLPQNLVDEILGRDKRGATVVTTIDPVLQKAAKQALGSLPGGVVALDPRTGEVLAMVDNPSYNPNGLASHRLDRVNQVWKQLLGEPGKPLLGTSQPSYSKIQGRGFPSPTSASTRAERDPG